MAKKSQKTSDNRTYFFRQTSVWSTDKKLWLSSFFWASTVFSGNRMESITHRSFLGGRLSRGREAFYSMCVPPKLSTHGILLFMGSFFLSPERCWREPHSHRAVGDRSANRVFYAVFCRIFLAWWQKVPFSSSLPGVKKATCRATMCGWGWIEMVTYELWIPPPERKNANSKSWNQSYAS